MDLSGAGTQRRYARLALFGVANAKPNATAEHLGAVLLHTGFILSSTMQTPSSGRQGQIIQGRR